MSSSARILNFEMCRRRLRNAERAPAPPVSPFARHDTRELTDRQIAHRRRMLAHLQRRRSVAS